LPPSLFAGITADTLLLVVLLLLLRLLLLHADRSLLLQRQEVGSVPTCPHEAAAPSRASLEL
jgi:hypothetical protein